MAHPWKHAQGTAKRFGGTHEGYLPIHNWFDQSKAFFADFRHRALRHHAEGIFLCEEILLSLPVPLPSPLTTTPLERGSGV